jgi:predicted MFS family arabinose efflux permease
LSDGEEREASLRKDERYRWLILTIVYLSILAFTFIFQSIPPVLPLIISELHLTYAQSGLFMSLFAFPGLFISLLGGFLSDRYGMRPLGMGCFLLMIGGTLLVGLGGDLRILWLGRITAGIGGLTLSVLLPKLLSQWFKDKELGLAMGIFNTGVPLGSVICFGLFGNIASLWGWRIPILLTGAYSLLTSVLFLSFYSLPSSHQMENPRPSGIYSSLIEMGLPIWWVGLSWLWFNAAFVSFATFAPSLFLQKGYSIEQSGLLIGIPLLGSLCLSPPTGYLVDRFRHQEWFIGIGGIVLSILTLFFNFSSSFLLLVILMAVFYATIPSPIYSLPPEILKPENVGLGFGVISTCSSVGLFAAPYLVGKAKDLTGSYSWSFILISLFFLLTTISIFFTHSPPGKKV